MLKPSAVAVYARISLDAEGTGLGVARQVADCRELAAREGWTIAEEYIDNDISAYSGKRRPAYERMLADLQDGLRDAVVVYHSDRLTRRPIELEQFLDVVNAAGVKHVRFASGADVNIGSGDGLMVLRIMGAVAAAESASKGRRAKRKMDEVAAAGMPHGGRYRPFGYEADRITVREDEAKVIRAMVARYLAGESLRSLTTWVESTGVPSVAGKPWRTTTVRLILGSARIAGLRSHRGHVIGQAVWAAIISEADRDRVLAKMEQRTSTRERTPRTYLLSGLVHCGRCDGKLFSSRRPDARRYVCMGGPDHGGCGKMTIVAEPLEELVTAAVLYRLDSPQLAEVLQGHAAQDEQTAALSEQLVADRAQLAELAQMFAVREIGRVEWLTAREAIDARVSDTERRLARMTRNDALDGVVGNGAALSATWAELSLSRQHAIVKAVMDRAVVAPGKRSPVFNPERVDLVWRI